MSMLDQLRAFLRDGELPGPSLALVLEARTQGLSAILDEALAPSLHAAGLTSVDKFLALGGPAGAPSVVTAIDLPVEGTVGRFHLKRYAYEGWGRSKGLLGRGTLWGTAPEVNEFRVLQWMRENQVPAVRPVAAAARTSGGRLVAHALSQAAPALAKAIALKISTPPPWLRNQGSAARAPLT